MKPKFLIPLHKVALFAILVGLLSCSKENAAPIPPQQIASSTVDALKVTPGTYTVLRFIDTGEDQTSEFNGYTFVFRADGTLIARTRNGSIFTGSWRLNSAQTRMTINIGGTKALKDLDDDNWQVVKITSLRISLQKPGPDRVVFVMQ
jgi:hypothetical protein